MSLGDEYRLLSEVPPLRVLDARQLKLLSFVCQRLTYDPGQPLCQQGEVADAVFMLIDGEVEVTIASHGEERSVRRMGRHAIIGEIGTLALGERTATVSALTPVSALRLEQAQFHKLLQDVPNLRTAIQQHIENADYVYE